jgi:hypothetical protein
MSEEKEPRDPNEDEELRKLLAELEKEDCPVDSVPGMKQKKKSVKKDDGITIQPLQRQKTEQRLSFEQPEGEITEVFQGQLLKSLMKF